MPRIKKVYTRVLSSWRWKYYPLNPVVPHEKNISVVDNNVLLDGDYIASWKLSSFKYIEQAVKSATQDGREIAISFVRMHGKRFIDEVNIL